MLQCREQSTAGDKPNWKARLGKIECPKGPPGYDRSLWFLLCVRAGISQSLMNEMKQKRHTAWNPKRNHFLLFLTVRSKGLPEAASGLFPPLGTTAPWWLMGEFSDSKVSKSKQALGSKEGLRS